MSECKHENAYLNTLSMNLSFWVCPDCKKELKEDPNKKKDLPPIPKQLMLDLSDEDFGFFD